MGAHTITKASTIVPGGILALGLAVVLLAATASTASAERGLSPWYCPPPSAPVTGVGTIDQVPQECANPSAGSFDFGDRKVGTTSPAQRFGLGVYCLSACNDTLTPNISVSGDYAQTNNCPPTLSATGPRQLQGCQINVTFAPTGTGPRDGTLSTGPGGPAVALTGYGFSATDSTPPDLQLSGDNTHKLGPACDSSHECRDFLELNARCGDEACTTLSAEGKLTKVKKAKPLKPSCWCDGDGRPIGLAPGERATLDLGLPASTQKKAIKALDDGKNVRAKVTVKAKDAAGNVATAKRTIKLSLDKHPPAWKCNPPVWGCDGFPRSQK
jgi:hypothetical protein